MAKKILVVVTSQERCPGHNRATGLWLGEAVSFVSRLQDARFKVDYVSPRGGYTPLDPLSLSSADDTDWAWYHNKQFMNRLGNTMAPEDVRPDEYGVIYYAGGHGAVWDIPASERLASVARRIHDGGGVVASVCHGACGLLNLKLASGEYLVAGKEVTGFSNEEERLAGLEKVVPFLIEDELKKRGAVFRSASAPFTSFAVKSQRLVTGQNPQSGAAVAVRVLELLTAS